MSIQIQFDFKFQLKIGRFESLYTENFLDTDFSPIIRLHTRLGHWIMSELVRGIPIMVVIYKARKLFAL